MPTVYRGKAVVKCLKYQCIVDKRQNVLPSCLDCEFSEAEMVDLEDKQVGAMRPRKQKAVARPTEEEKEG
jgi:hypothetical protein